MSISGKRNMNTFNITVKIGLLIISLYFINTVDGICSSLDSQNPCLKWSKCRRSGAIENLSRLSLPQCWNQCRLRPKCKAINYWRRKLSCDIIYTHFYWGSLIPSSYGPCVRIDQNNPQSPTCAGCRAGGICHSDVGTCTYKACLPLHVTAIVNKTIYGNKRSVGSIAKVVYLDNQIATLSLKQICQPNGLWAPVYHRISEDGVTSAQSIRFYDKTVTQLEATEACAAANQSLIKIDSRAKFDDVIEFVQNIPGYDSLQYWIQGRHINGEWRDANGDLYTYDFLPFSDMNGGGEPCIRIVGATINDKGCSTRYGFICENINM